LPFAAKLGATGDFHVMEGYPDRPVEAGHRQQEEAGLGRNRFGYADPRRWGVAAAGREGCRGEGYAGDQDRDEICAFCKQAGNRAGISGIGT
jgi:hypothetical protein